MINVLTKSIELMEAIKTDNPQPIVDYFKRNDGKCFQGFMNYSLNPIYFIISEIIAQDKTKLMQELLSSQANPFALGTIQNDVAVTPVINAIIQHKHTETICCIVENYNFRKSSNISNCLTTAVLAENIPVMQFIKNLPEVEIKCDERPLVILPTRTTLKTTVDYELIQTLIDTERYDLLDMLTDNGKSLKKLGVCESILLVFEHKNIKKYLTAIAKRYLPDYEKSRNKTKALKSFLECNADLKMVADRIFHFPYTPFSFDEEKSFHILSFYLGSVLKPIKRITSFPMPLQLQKIHTFLQKKPNNS